MSRNASLANRGPNDRDYRASTAAGPKFETVVRRVTYASAETSRTVAALDRVSATATPRTQKPDGEELRSPRNAVET